MVRWQYNDVRYALYVDELLDNAARARTKGLSHTIHLVGHFFADGNSIIQPPRLFNAQDTERVISNFIYGISLHQEPEHPEIKLMRDFISKDPNAALEIYVPIILQAKDKPEISQDGVRI